MNEPELAALVAAIAPLDTRAMAAARRRLDELTKPRGSLGRLEDLAVHLAGITGEARPRIERPAIAVFAADHGVTARGVSAYPADVTAQMVGGFLAEHAAINVLARQAGARVAIVDVGVRSELPPHPRLLARKVAAGTRDFTVQPAMTRAETFGAIAVGVEIANTLVAEGADALVTGEMGIGNTTAASALVAVFSGRAVADVTGRGTGVDPDALARKIGAIEAGLALHRPAASDAIGTLCALGGLEIAALAGFILGGAAGRVPVVLDGHIAGAAALVACALAPRARDRLIAGHRSIEPGHGATLEALGLSPLLDLELRLGEGSGAALALHLAVAAVRLLDEMATFAEAAVSEALRPERTAR